MRSVPPPQIAIYVAVSTSTRFKLSYQPKLRQQLRCDATGLSQESQRLDVKFHKKRKTQMSRKWSLWVLSGGHKCLSFKPTIFCLMLFPLLKNVAIASAPLLLASLATSAVCSFEAPALACGLRNHGAKSIWIYWTNGKAGKKCATNSCKAESVVFFWVSKLVEEISQWDKVTQGYKKDTKRYKKSLYHVWSTWHCEPKGVLNNSCHHERAMKKFATLCL
jgi:hypothetical protein